MKKVLVFVALAFALAGEWPRSGDDSFPSDVRRQRALTADWMFMLRLASHFSQVGLSAAPPVASGS